MGSTTHSAVVPVAVVGISCRLPGGSNSPSQLWDFLARGGEAWSPVPSDRYNGAAFHHPSPDDPNGSSHHQGGHFIDADVRDFDHAFFRLSPQQAAAMDPQQRFLLEMTYEALENAGWTREGIAGSSTSVYTAMFPADYERNLYKDPLNLPIYYSTGSERAILANRVSHYFDLHGPSVTLDTACSGGLVALHQACQSLQAGESNASFVASANLTLGPDQHIGMSNLHLVGASGRSYPFDDRGTGYGRGEGLVVLALKRLDDALRDHDPVRAVIRGTAVNQDGYTPSGITYPNGAAQVELIRNAYTRSGLWPEDVPYVEAHGTGTVAGDTEELNALSKVFATSHRSLPLYVGSIKGNIGHTENTSGLASVVKATMILEHQKIPPVAGFFNPKPGLPLDKIRIPTELIPLPVRDGLTPTVSINSFGFGGTNAHAILQAGKWSPPSRCEAIQRLFVFSAHNEASLKNMINAQIGWLRKESEPSLADLSYTLCHRRSKLNWRFSCVAQDTVSLIEQLEKGMRSGSFKPKAPDPYLVFVFTGQGAQWVGMGRELLHGKTASPIFLQSIRNSARMLTSLGADWDLEVELLQPPANTRLNQALLAQPATTAIQIALVDMLRTQGIHPRIVVGHSSGEIAAAYSAGRVSHQAAIGIAYHRGCVAGLPKSHGLHGAMMSVGLGENEVLPFMEGLSGRVGVACVNSPTNVTLSGDAEAVEEVERRLADNQNAIFHRKLLVDTAYHSHHMQVVEEDYLHRLVKLEGICDGPRGDVAFISTVTGLLKTGEFDPAYWTRNLVSPVRFCDGLQAVVRHRLAEAPGRDILFIEIGPHSALAGPVRQILSASTQPGVEFDYYSMLQRKVDALASTLSLAGSLFEKGVSLQLKGITALSEELETPKVCTTLPSYPWDHSDKHWHESRVTRQYLMRSDPYHDLLGVRGTDSTPIQPRWRHMICLNTLPWLADHVIDGVVVFPGSGYLCMVIEAMRQVYRERQISQQLETINICNISFLRALVVPGSPERVEMQLTFEPQSSSSLEFRFRITAHTDDWNEYCCGVVEGRLMETMETETMSEEDMTKCETHNGSDLNPQTLYKDLADMGNTYGPSFQGIKSFVIGSNLEAQSTVAIPDIASVMPARHHAVHLIHPSTLDIILHTTLPLMKQKIGPGSVVPTHIEDLLISATAAMPHQPGDELTAVTKLTSGGARTVQASLSVSSGTELILTAHGIEMQNLGSRFRQDDADPSGICYELDWKPDINFLWRAQCTDISFEDFVESVCFKYGVLSVLEVGSGNEGLASTFISAVTQHGKLDTYGLVHSSDSRASELSDILRTHDIRLVCSESDEKEPEIWRFYNVVLISDINVLATVELREFSGLLLVRIEPSESVEDWRAALHYAHPEFKVQVMTSEGSSTMLVAHSRAQSRGRAPKCRVLTHSKAAESTWVQNLVQRLRMTSSDLLVTDIETNAGAVIEDDLPLIIIDDQPQAILSDPTCFENVTDILSQANRVIWISPDAPMPMHQITGVARTAHAENDKLCLTTIHVATKQLDSDSLKDLVSACLQEDREAEHREREYVIGYDGSVLIPRLRPSEELNQAILNDKDPDGIANATLPASVAEDEVIVDLEAYAITKSGLEKGPWEIIGRVSQTGTAVKDLVSGDRVLAISNTPPSKNLCITQKYVTPLADHIPIEYSSTLLSLMVAGHALHKLADLPAPGTILVHGVREILGRAIVAAAKSMGHRAVVTAKDSSEATLLAKQLDIPQSDILVSNRSLNRRFLERRESQKWDGIILTGNKDVPQEAFSQLRPFGSIIILDSYINLENYFVRAPTNTAVFRCDIAELIRCRPESVPDMMGRVSTALEYLRMDGLDLMIRNERDLEESRRVIERGSASSVVLVANEVPKYEATALGKPPYDWSRYKASYVIAGGLGDLGKRLMILLARRGVKHLVTLSRRLPSPEDKEKAQAIIHSFNFSCTLHCISCDLTSETSVQNAAKAMEESGIPPVRGIIQSAAILQDRPLSFMTHKDFRAASEVKVNGTLALEQVFGCPSLEFFITLSSAVNIVGASSQANYNAGNAVQDALAHRRRESSCRYMSLNIGWIEDAMHTVDNDARLGAIGRLGLREIRSEELNRYFNSVLDMVASGTSIPQAIIGFDAASLAKATTHNGNIKSPMFCHVQPPLQGKEITDMAVSAEVSFQQVFEVGNHEAIVQYISESLRSRLGQLLSLEASRINIDHSMHELGLDSLVAIELRNWLMRTFDCPMQPSEILDNQTVRALGEKVALRSRYHKTLPEDDKKEAASHSKNDTLDGAQHSKANVREQQSSLPPLPTPDLHETLRLLEDSRRAFDSKKEQETTAMYIKRFINGLGPVLQQKVSESPPGVIADSYERQLYLQRREPLQDYSEFTLVHPIDAPSHSQTLRAAIVTAAAVEYARQLLTGQVPEDLYDGMPVNGESREWMFWTTRLPGLDIDRMKRHTPSQKVVVLRRGHVFELLLPQPQEPLKIPSLQMAFEKIVELSEEQVPQVCTLTAADRQSWFPAREKLEASSENSVILAAIDSAMFVVGLDDESPLTPGERHTQFLLGGKQSFSNRWLDKPVQFAITANGCSAGIFEHTKLDALDVRQLHRHVTRKLFSYRQVDCLDTEKCAYAVQQHKWYLSASLFKSIENVQANGTRYGHIDHLYFMADQLTPRRLRSKRISLHAIAHLVAVFAVYMVDNVARPTWEIVSLSSFSRGRLDWLQTVSPDIRSFIEEAAHCVDRECSDDARSSLFSKLSAACQGYSQRLSAASRGHGYVRHLYALLGACEDSGQHDLGIFQTPAWNATRRDGVGQNFKIGFMPDEEPEFRKIWDEGGFLMHGKNGIYIHCGVRDKGISFAISARSEYAEAVCKSMSHVSSLISTILG